MGKKSGVVRRQLLEKIVGKINCNSIGEIREDGYFEGVHPLTTKPLILTIQEDKNLGGVRRFVDYVNQELRKESSGRAYIEWGMTECLRDKDRHTVRIGYARTLPPNHQEEATREVLSCISVLIDRYTGNRKSSE